MSNISNIVQINMGSSLVPLVNSKISQNFIGIRRDRGRPSAKPKCHLLISFLSAICCWAGITLMLLGIRNFSWEWNRIFASWINKITRTDNTALQFGEENKPTSQVGDEAQNLLGYGFVYILVVTMEAGLVMLMTIVMVPYCYRKMLGAMNLSSRSGPLLLLIDSGIWLVTGLFLFALVEVLILIHTYRDEDGNSIFYVNQRMSNVQDSDNTDFDVDSDISSGELDVSSTEEEWATEYDYETSYNYNSSQDDESFEDDFSHSGNGETTEFDEDAEFLPPEL